MLLCMSLKKVGEDENDMCIVMSTVTAVQSMLFCQRSNIPGVVLNAISILSTYLSDIFSLI
jgi:hypothetical protein